nr:hypothetical protein [Streptomyces sp. FT05W]
MAASGRSPRRPRVSSTWTAASRAAPQIRSSTGCTASGSGFVKVLPYAAAASPSEGRASWTSRPMPGYAADPLVNTNAVSPPTGAAR